MIRKMITTCAIAAGLLAGSGAGQALAQPVALATSPTPIESSIAALPTQDPPVGADENGVPFAPCGPGNDGQTYYTRDAQGFPRIYRCTSIIEGQWFWQEVQVN